MKKLNYIHVCGLLIIALTLAGCRADQGNAITIDKITKQSENNKVTDYNFTTWNEKKLYDFLKEVKEYTNQIGVKTYPSKEEIITKYQTYFTPKLSGTIVDSLFVKTDGGWKVPETDYN